MFTCVFVSGNFEIMDVRSTHRRNIPEEERGYESGSDDENILDFSSGSEDEWLPETRDHVRRILVNLSDSDAEEGGPPEQEEEIDSSDDENEALNEIRSVTGLAEEETEMTARDGTVWLSRPPVHRRMLPHNICREGSGPHASTRNLSIKDTFKKIFSDEICSIIVRETNRKGREIIAEYNRTKAKHLKDKTWKPITLSELDTFLGLLIIAGVYHNKRTSIRMMWGDGSHPIFRASMNVERFVWLNRCIRFDNSLTRETRKKTDKAAAIRDIWTMVNANLSSNYKPSDCLTVDEQLFPYRGGTRFTQYIPSKPAKYGIKVWWICDKKSFYPLKGSIYTGKLPNEPRQVNQGENVVKELVQKYKGSGRNVTMDNFFTTLPLAKLLMTWGLSMVGTLRKNKRCIPASMLPSNTRPVESTLFGFHENVAMCSYVPKKGKCVILLSTVHYTKEVSGAQKKPEAIQYYNKSKAAVDIMDKMLGEYTSKRTTRRWTYAFFFNILDVAALAAYILYAENNKLDTTSSKKRSIRRSTLLELGTQLALPAVTERSKDQRVCNTFIKRIAIEYVLGSPIMRPVGTATIQQSVTGDGRRKITGCCYICKDGPEKRRRKTRKSCCYCNRPICDQHTLTISKCHSCEPQAGPSSAK